MISWALASIRHRAAASLGVVVAVLIGVAVTTATLQILMATRPAAPERLQAATIVVASRASHDVLGRKADRQPWGGADLDQLVSELRAVPWVTAVVPDRTFRAQIVTPHGIRPDDSADEAGHDWSSRVLASSALTSGAAPSNPGEVAVGQEFGLRPGQDVVLRTALGERPVRVSGVLDGRGIYVDDATAGRLAPGASVLGIIATGDMTTIEAQIHKVGGAYHGAVVTDRREFEDASTTHRRYLSNQFLLALALASSIITVFIVAVTSKFAVDARTHEFGLVRAIGALPGTLRRLVVGESILLGGAGATGGMVLGLLAVGPLTGLLRSWDILPAKLTVPRDPQWALAAGLSGLATSILGAASSAVAASRLDVLAALRPVTADRATRGARTRVVLGLLGLAIAGAEVTARRLNPDIDSVTVSLLLGLTLATSCVCLAPTLLRVLGNPLLWCAARVRYASLLVGVAEVVRAPRRAASLAAPMIMASTLAVLTSGFIPTMAVAYPAESRSRTEAESVLVAMESTHLTLAQVEQARHDYPVQRVAVTTRVHVPIVGGSLVAPAVSLPAERGGDALEVPRYLAEQHGWSTATPLHLVMADGQLIVRPITAVIDEPRGEHPGIGLPEGVIRAHDPSAATTAIFLHAIGGAPSTVSGTQLVSADEWSRARHDKDLTLLRRYLLAFVTIAIGYAVLASTITLTMSMRHRHRQTDVLARTGATRSQICGSVVTEAVVAALVGGALGGFCAIAPLHEMAAGLSETAGQPVGVHLGWLQAVGIPAATVATMGLAALVAGASITRTRSQE